jgi:hypothetical protein
MPEGVYSDHDLKHGIHAGDMETSVMLEMHPDLVDMSKARDFRTLTELLRVTSSIFRWAEAPSPLGRSRISILMAPLAMRRSQQPRRGGRPSILLPSDWLRFLRKLNERRFPGSTIKQPGKDYERGPQLASSILPDRNRRRL